MSEERRKRQEEREGSRDGKTKKVLIYGVVLILLTGAYVAGWYYKNHKYDAFAKCLATKQAKMYGLYWCPHCIEQKEMFGAAFHYVPYGSARSRVIGNGAGVQGRGSETVSQLAVRVAASEGRGLVAGSIE